MLFLFLCYFYFYVIFIFIYFYLSFILNRIYFHSIFLNLLEAVLG
jgi:hypothetical protein